MVQYQGKELFVEKSKKDGRLFTPAEQENSYYPQLEGSEPVETTEEEVKAGVEYYKKYHKCKIHMFYDRPVWVYDERVCGICGKSLGLL